MALARSRLSFRRPPSRRDIDVPSNHPRKRTFPRQLSSDQTQKNLRSSISPPTGKHQGDTSDSSKISGPTTTTLTATSFILTLPLPPSINHQYATVNGRRVLSSTGRRYKADIGKIIGGLLPLFSHRHRFLQDLHEHFLALSLHFYFPTMLRRDLDGGLKIAQDALCQSLGINDNRIIEVHLLKSADAAYPRMECTLSLLQPVQKARLSRKRVKPHGQ